MMSSFRHFSSADGDEARPGDRFAGLTLSLSAVSASNSAAGAVNDMDPSTSRSDAHTHTKARTEASGALTRADASGSSGVGDPAPGSPSFSSASPAPAPDEPPLGAEESGLASDLLRPIAALSLLPRVEDASWSRRARRRLYITCSGDTTSVCGSLVYCVSTVAIFLALALMTAQTLPEYRLRVIRRVQGGAEVAFSVCELIIVVVFVAEFVCRVVSVSAVTDSDKKSLEDSADMATYGVYAAESKPRQALTLKLHMLRTLKFMIHPMTLIDMASFIPYFIESAGFTSSGAYATVLRVIRVTRVLQLLKFTSRTAAFKVLVRTLQASFTALILMAVYFLLASFFFGALMFYAEAGEWDEDAGSWTRWNIAGTEREVSPFQSILHASYYVVVTMSTTGYGDFVPTSAPGRILACFAMVTGVLCVAMPITIITSHFPKEYALYESKRKDRMAAMQARLGSAFDTLKRRASTRTMSGRLPPSPGSPSAFVRTLSSSITDGTSAQLALAAGSRTDIIGALPLNSGATGERGRPSLRAAASAVVRNLSVPKAWEKAGGDAPSQDAPTAQALQRQEQSLAQLTATVQELKALVRALHDHVLDAERLRGDVVLQPLNTPTS